MNFKVPEVAAFDKFIETPVSHYTGIPNISTPIYEITIKGVKVHIVLNYHAGGIRVDEEATWIGLGWSLDYGGQISRKVRGKPDEACFLRTNETQFTYNTIAYFKQLAHFNQDSYLQDRTQFMYNAKTNISLTPLDYMPDEFYYNVQGYSGRFMFNQLNNKFVFFPKEDIDVSYDLSNLNSRGYQTSNYHIQDFNMKLPSGASVSFGQEGFSEHKTNSDVFYTRDAWMVKSLQNNYNETINYTYQPFNYSSEKLSGESFSAMTKDLTGFVMTESYNDAMIKRIDFPGGSINFITGPRDDMPTQALTEIDIKDLNGTLIKKIIFSYGYFNGSFASSPRMSYVSDNYRNKRLRLDSLSIVAANMQPIAYRFGYYMSDISTMPSKYSYAQDFWGFSMVPQL